jgi:hypothetical protein
MSFKFPARTRADGCCFSEGRTSEFHNGHYQTLRTLLNSETYLVTGTFFTSNAVNLFLKSAAGDNMSSVPESLLMCLQY